MYGETLGLLCATVTKKSTTTKKIRPRLRISFGTDIALGPGKAELLELLDRTGSITQAARGMGMSYMRAWTLIGTMNRCFKKPLVVAVRGGTKGGGGSTLTETGHQALALYQEMSIKCLKTIQSDWTKLQKLLCGKKIRRKSALKRNPLRE